MRQKVITSYALIVTALIAVVGWLATQPRSVGYEGQFDDEELQFHGRLRLVEISPCPEIEPGEGAVVTGRFLHSPKAKLWSLTVEGSDKPIVGTENHRFWSETRLDWIAMSDLAVGELVRAYDGLARVIDSQPVEGRQPVVNLEVHREHVYLVGDQGVLVHNAWCSEEARWFKGGVSVFSPSRLKPQKHHIATIYGDVGKRLRGLFDEAGVSMESAWNKTRIAGHQGPHGKFYNEYILERLTLATAGKSGAAFREGLLDGLYDLRRQLINGDLDALVTIWSYL